MGRGARLSDELYVRGMDTVIASWSEYARGARGASVQRLPGVTAAVFPEGPERRVYNNAVLERAEAVDAMKVAYAEAGIEGFAAWTHERDASVRAELERRGYTLVESTRAMGMPLAAARPPRPDVELRPASWAEYLRVDDLPEGILAGVDPDAFHVVIGSLDGATASLQSTPMAEGVYAAAGFRDLGRILEYGPPGFRAETDG